MEFSGEAMNALARVLTEKFGFTTARDLDIALNAIKVKTAERMSNGTHFSFTKLARGLSAMQGRVIAPATVDQDIQFVRALGSGTVPGSYLVPTLG